MTEHSKVVSLNGEPRPKVIALLEELLERAKSGEIMALSVCQHHSDDTHSHVHEGRITLGTVGSVERLKLDLVNVLNKE